jgi:SmpA / OmlA family
MPVTKTVLFRRAGALLVVLATAGCAISGRFRPPATEADLATIQAGMTREQVLARVGPPTWIFGVRQENLSIWNYRFNRSDCIIYQVSVRPDGTVRDAGTGWDPACDGPPGRD